VGARVCEFTTVLEVFREAGSRWGFPAALLTDNGCVYTTWHRGGPNVMQTELLALGIDYRHSRPYHPQTCGKVERFHRQPRVVIQHVHDLDLGAVGKPPVGDVGLPALVRQLRLEPDPPGLVNRNPPPPSPYPCPAYRFILRRPGGENEPFIMTEK